MGLTDEASVAARWAPEFFTDVGFVQAPDMESTLLDQGKGKGRSEFRHFLTGEPIPVTCPDLLVVPSTVARSAGDGPPVSHQELTPHGSCFASWRWLISATSGRTFAVAASNWKLG